MIDSAKEMPEEVEDSAWAWVFHQLDGLVEWGPICQKWNYNGLTDICHPTMGLWANTFCLTESWLDIDQFCHFNPAEYEQKTEK